MDFRPVFQQGVDLSLGNHAAADHNGLLPFQIEKDGIIGHKFILMWTVNAKQSKCKEQGEKSISM